MKSLLALGFKAESLRKLTDELKPHELRVVQLQLKTTIYVGLRGFDQIEACHDNGLFVKLGIGCFKRTTPMPNQLVIAQK